VPWRSLIATDDQFGLIEAVLPDEHVGQAWPPLGHLLDLPPADPEVPDTVCGLVGLARLPAITQLSFGVVDKSICLPNREVAVLACAIVQATRLQVLQVPGDIVEEGFGLLATAWARAATLRKLACCMTVLTPAIEFDNSLLGGPNAPVHWHCLTELKLRVPHAHPQWNEK
jgi:hypothetical protein